MRTLAHVSGDAARASASSSIRIWLQAIRPKTLVVSVVPVVAGTALAYGHGVGRLAPALAAGIGALLIQMGTNFINDYYDFKKGADTSERVGPMRVTQHGLIAPSTVLAAGLICFAAATVAGTYLVVIGGWPIVAIGLLSLAAGYAYTGGPFPLGYHGLGEAFVFIFFGLVAVAGTYYVQAGTLHPVVWFVAVPMGALASAVLVVNNLRDIATDSRAGKRTIAVRFGARATRFEYCALLAIAFAAPLLLWVSGGGSAWVLLGLLSAPLAFGPIRRVFFQSDAVLNEALAGTARLQLAFGLFYSLGLVLSRGGLR